MSDFVEGRRVAEHEPLERSGDYRVSYGESGKISSVLFVTPGFLDFNGEIILNVITGPAAAPERPCWEVSEDADGKITASPSFLAVWPERGAQRRFHCFLRDGVFEVLDDTTPGELPD